MAGGVGFSTQYHLDYAELYRRRRGILHPPILASTVHVTDFGSTLSGGRGGDLWRRLVAGV